MKRVGKPVGSSAARPSPKTFLNTPFVLACAMQLTGSLAAAMYILFPLFVRSVGGTETIIGVFAGVGAVSAVAVRWPLGVLLDRLGRKPVMIGATLCHFASSVGFVSVRELDL